MRIHKNESDYINNIDITFIKGKKLYVNKSYRN